MVQVLPLLPALSTRPTMRSMLRETCLASKPRMADADYQANGPPPSPNPSPAKEESSPVSPPATAPSSSASKEKHALEHTPASIPSTSGLHVDKSSVVIKKWSMSRSVTLVAANLIHRASKVVSRIAGGDWYGWRR
ncbi:hypothetical protein DFH08DRAFT_1084980 [Mycena albidolilacea]|uniref:Uncharacterized protein n=1 Tax=Mycena albidolilacea TaxID=1033008 RepID=A0AAD6ZL93_9AGAR|nr:hypothetical protein DFH08DRAFT_1084980 [Mycena albidolilacea]